MQCIIKDTLYFCFFTLFVLESFSIYERPQKRSFLFFLLIGALTCILRNNGVYVVLPTLLVLIIIVNNKRDRGWLLITGTLLVAVCILNFVLPKMMGINQGSVWEMYSVPCQQIARCVVKHGDVLTDDEKAEIDFFFPYEDIEQSYKAGISDPVKNNARIHRPTKDEMTRFWSLWKSLLYKYPGTYIEATLNGIWGYLDPFWISRDSLQFTFYIKRTSGDDVADAVSYFEYFFSKDTRVLFSELAKIWNLIPILQLLVMPGFYVWFILFLFVDSVFKYKWRQLLLMVPALLTILICFVSPVNGYMRYMLPVCGATPIYMSFFLNNEEIGADEQ